MLEMFEYPFMQRAFIVGISLGAVLACLGVFVVIRNMAFFSGGIAHASLSGVALGVLAGWNPLITAMWVACLFAVIMFFLERKTSLSTDAVIGLIFPSGMALGVLLMSLRSGHQPDLISFLFGNILTISKSELVLITILALLIGFFLVLFQRQITLLAVDREMAHLAKFHPDALQLAMYVVLAVSVVLGIKMLGVVLVSALLVIPVSISKLIARSFKALLAWSIIVAEVVVVSGLIISYTMDLPAGAVIVLAGTVLFFAVFVLQKGLRRR